MKKNVLVVVLMLAGSLVSPHATVAQEADARALALQARGVLKTYCYRCHHGVGSDGGDFDVQKVETLTAPRDADKHTIRVLDGKSPL